MAFWLKLADKLDGFSKNTGKWISWLTLAMVLVGTFNALARALSKSIGVNLASNALLEAQWYLFSLVFLLGAAYALQQNSHVRVDVLYGRLSVKARAWVNLGGSLLFLIPFCIILLMLCWPSVRASWSVWEQSPDPAGLPRYPIKSVVLAAFSLLLIQAVSQVIKNVAILRGNLPRKAEPEEATS